MALLTRQEIIDALERLGQYAFDDLWESMYGDA